MIQVFDWGIVSIVERNKSTYLKIQRTTPFDEQAVSYINVKVFGSDLLNLIELFRSEDKKKSAKD